MAYFMYDFWRKNFVKMKKSFYNYFKEIFDRSFMMEWITISIEIEILKQPRRKPQTAHLSLLHGSI